MSPFFFELLRYKTAKLVVANILYLLLTMKILNHKCIIDDENIYLDLHFQSIKVEVGWIERCKDNISHTPDSTVNE